MVIQVDSDSGHPSVSSAGDAATELIRRAILEGKLAPAARLGEEQLARELGTSRTPVRQAFQRLSREGLIELMPNRGAFVRSYSHEELGDLYELRALLEGHAARLAAAKVTDAQLVELAASCDRFEQLSAIDDLVAENARFHEQIITAADSKLLSGMVGQVVKMPLVYRTYVWYSPDQKNASAYFHRQLTAAFERRDSMRAELIMREHVLGARDVLLAHLREERDT